MKKAYQAGGKPFILDSVDHLAQINSILLRLPAIRQWPVLKELITKNSSRPHLDWEFPWYVARAVGSESGAILYGAAALACLQMSIILVDDLLDDDQKGIHNKVGVGQAANMAQVLQAAAFLLLEQVDLPAQQRLDAISLFTRTAMETAAGQQLDVSIAEMTEQNYWAVVKAKSVPFYIAAMKIGGVIASVDENVQEVLSELGTCLGEMIQIHDDMGDALQIPANPDWLENRFNLLLLYATIVDHPQRQRFIQLREDANDPQALAEAQNILIQCGAASYGVYHLIKRNEYAHGRIQYLQNLPSQQSAPIDPDPLIHIFNLHIKPVVTLLNRHQIQLPNMLRFDS